MIIHDGLCLDDQEYLHTQWGMRDRQIRSLGITSRGTRYYRKLVGNSPELCLGLDAHGFSDLEAAIAYHVSITRLPYTDNNPHKFKTGTPDEMWSTMSRCWKVAPSRTRIVDNIVALPRVLRLIVAANGYAVADDNLRSGSRYIAIKDCSELKGNPRKRRRINTLMDATAARHPDAFAL